VLLPLLPGLVGCAYASWDTATRAPGYAVPRTIPIWVDITDKVLRADDHGYTSTMIQSMEEGLVSRGFEPHIFTRTVGAVNETRHLPRVDVVVRSWDEGNHALRVLSPFGGEPSLLVECAVLSADNKPIFAGRLTASQSTSGWESPRDAAATAAIAGELLARTVAGR
jgi:hypothetical protein